MQITRRGLLGALAGAGIAPLPEVTVHSARPDDLLVLRFPKGLSEDHHACISHSLQSQYPDLRFLLLDGGISLEVVRRP